MDANCSYSNFISLGYFCSPAIELQRVGVRIESYPFDWLITPDFSIVLRLINSNFSNFLAPEYMYQDNKQPNHYKNDLLNILFYHDFDELKSFSSQIEVVTAKYTRRINRFYERIKLPTLFIRYVRSQEEYNYIHINQKSILEQLKAYNKDNCIVYIVNDDILIEQSTDNIYHVQKDTNDTVARTFLDKLPSLKDYIIKSSKSPSVDPSNHKQKKKTAFNIILHKLCRILKIYYHHDKQYNH